VVQLLKINTQHFMQPEGLLPCSREPATGRYPEPVQSNNYHLYPTPLTSTLILSTNLHFGVPSGLFLTDFPTNSLYAISFAPIRSTCPAHLIFHDFIIVITFGKEHKLRSSSLCSFLRPPFTSSLFGPNILPNTLFSK
jgi:hypothetical protein